MSLVCAPETSSSRNLEPLRERMLTLGFLNIRDPGPLSSAQKFSGSRILRKATLISFASFSKFRDDDVWGDDDLSLNTLPATRKHPL